MPGFGKAIPLSAKAHDDDAALFIRAKVYDPNDVELVGSPVTLAHVSDGFYSNDALLMPNVDFVHAVYDPFIDAGFTVKSVDHLPNSETFFIDKADSLVGPLKPTDLVLTVDEENERILSVEDAGELVLIEGE